MPRECHHWRAPVRVGDHHILCSSWIARPLDRPTIEWRPYPDAAYYLDPQWRDGAPEHRAWPRVFVDWPDMGVIPLERLRALVAEIAENMDQGRSVEIGCIGGHGRTGTLLAALVARIERRTASEAILAARERYCPSSIETAAQVELIHEMCD